jgi:hypothetical protein
LRADDEVSPADQSTAVAEQRELVPILTGLFQIFGLEGVDVNVDVLFESILSQADENARPDLQSALSQHSDEVVDGENIRANWREAITDSDFYVRPLLQAHGLGRAARPPIVEQARLKFAQLQAAAPAGGRTIREPEDYNRFHASRVGMIHGTPRDPFSQSLRLVRDQIFQGNLGYTTNTGSQLYEEYRASIDRYVEGTPSPHGEYEPVLVESAEIDGATVHTYTYQRVRIQKQNGEVEEVTPPRFTATVRGGRVASISARGLRFKEILADVQSGQRGRMQSPPDYDSNLLLNRSHLVADEFMGSAYRNSGNVIVTSETYNQQDMREAERDISEIIGAHATRAAGGNADDLLERITFDMEISVDYANSVFDAQIRQEAENSILNILRQNDSIVEDVTELEHQWNDINSTLETKLHNVQPVRRVTYSITANLDGNQLTAFSQRIGPDIYLGFAIGAVRAVFRAAAN